MGKSWAAVDGSGGLQMDSGGWLWVAVDGIGWFQVVSSSFGWFAVFLATVH